MAYTKVILAIVTLAIALQCSMIDSIRDKKPKKQSEKSVTTIKTEYDDIYDCVDMYKQPALKHPVLVNHTIKMQPGKEILKILAQGEATRNTHSLGYTGDLRIGLKKGCPLGTVPIRRITQEQRTQIKTNAERGLHFGLEDQINGDGQVEFAGIYTIPGSYRGASAYMSLHQPRIDPGSKKYSSAVIEIASGDAQHLNRIRVGWTVNPALYRDNKVRFFIQWEDLATGTGCYNVMCPGFVWTNHDIPLDAVLPYNKFNQYPYLVLKLKVIQDMKDKTWWLIVGNNVAVGYWPASLFTSLNLKADYVRWGGEVFTPANDDSSPEMGSGIFYIEPLYKESASFNQVKVIDDSFSTILPDKSFIRTAESRCYLEGDESYKEDTKGYSFVYGGTGGTPKTCF